MMTLLLRPLLAAAAFLFLLSCPSFAHSDLEASMAEKAQALLDSLDEGQLRLAQQPFDEERKDWHFIPKARDGLSFKEMTDEQEALVYELLSTGLSDGGVKTVEDIVSLELVLREIEGPGRERLRDPERYHVWVFGKPGDAAWGWRFEGHHVSVNATIVKGEGVSMTPIFLGANPAEVPRGNRKGFRALPKEEDLAFEFMDTLNAAQLKKAVFETEAPWDIFTGADREIKPLPIEGVLYSDLNTNQKEQLKEIVDVYLLRNRPDIRDAALRKVEASGWEQVVFGWAGPVDREKGNYYFIQGTDFLIEYDNTQNNNNHIHCVWREFDGDFGEDLIRAHRESVPHTH